MMDQVPGNRIQQSEQVRPPRNLNTEKYVLNRKPFDDIIGGVDLTNTVSGGNLMKNQPQVTVLPKVHTVRNMIPPPQPVLSIPSVQPTCSLPIPVINDGQEHVYFGKKKTTIHDLTKGDGGEFVLCKLPIVIFKRVKDMDTEDRNIKGSWTEEEDRVLAELVRKNGPKRWTSLAKNLRGRVGKQCRERYLNHLDPNINKTEWSEDEDKLVVKLQKEYGNKWAKISKDLSGRTPNMIKNRWNSTLKKRYGQKK